jgi:hypothetical protein
MPEIAPAFGFREPDIVCSPFCDPAEGFLGVPAGDTLRRLFIEQINRTATCGCALKPHTFGLSGCVFLAARCTFEDDELSSVRKLEERVGAFDLHQMPPSYMSAVGKGHGLV